jgi:hypothetical protein
MTINLSGSRKALVGSRPVGFRPAPGRFPPRFFGVAFFISWLYRIQACKTSGPPWCVNTPTSLTATRGMVMSTATADPIIISPQHCELSLRLKLRKLGLRLERRGFGYRLLSGA